MSKDNTPCPVCGHLIPHMDIVNMDCPACGRYIPDCLGWQIVDKADELNDITGHEFEVWYDADAENMHFVPVSARQRKEDNISKIYSTEWKKELGTKPEVKEPEPEPEPEPQNMVRIEIDLDEDAASRLYRMALRELTEEEIVGTYCGKVLTEMFNRKVAEYEGDTGTAEET